MKQANKDIIYRALMRWLRVAVALVAGSMIPEFIRVLGLLELSVEQQTFVAAFLVPTLVALDKIARDRGYY